MNPVTGARALALTFGGGVRLVWTNPADADFDRVRILRKLTNTISGPADPAATVVYEGKGARTNEAPTSWTINPSPAIADGQRRDMLDRTGIAWNTTYYYAIFATNAGASVWSVAATCSVRTPEISALDELDVIGVLIDYLDAYMKRQVALNALTLRDGQSIVEIHDAPPLIDTVMLPCVSVHLDYDRPTDFLLGDQPGDRDSLGDPERNRRSTFCEQRLAITGWTENPEIRRGLYRTLKAALTAVREVMERLGVNNLTLTGQYQEDFESYAMPMYMASFQLTGILETSVMEVPIEPVITSIDVHSAALSPVALIADT